MLGILLHTVSTQWLLTFTTMIIIPVVEIRRFKLTKVNHLRKEPKVERGQGSTQVPISGLQGFHLTLKCFIPACWLENMPGRWHQKRRNQVPEYPCLLQGDCMGSSGGPGGRGILTYPANPDWTLSASTSSQPPLPQESSCEGETCEFWKGTVSSCSCALLCKCYTNWSLKSGPNDAILLCLPASLTPILRCTVQMLVYYVHQ